MKTINEQLITAILLQEEAYAKIEKAEEVCDKFAVSFSLFCAENYVFNSTHWTRLGRDYTIEELLTIYKNTLK